MKLKAMVVVALVAAAVVFTGLAGARAAQMMAASPTAVAVVDVQGIFDKLSEKAAIEADLRDKADKFNKENTSRRQQLTDLETDLKNLNTPGTAEYNNKMNEYEQKAMELDSWTRFQEQKALRERSVQIEAIYRKMTDAAGRVAQQQGYDMVLFKEPTINLANVKPDALMTAIQIRKIIWSNPKLDLSRDVVEVMNNDYKAGKK